MADPKITGVTVTDIPGVFDSDLRELGKTQAKGLTGLLYENGEPKADQYFGTSDAMRDSRNLLSSGHQGRIRVINFDQTSHDQFFNAPLDYVDGIWYVCVKATPQEM